MRITDQKYLSLYKLELGENLTSLIDKQTISQQEVNLDFRIKTSAVYSANIEGNSLDINSFMNSEISKEAFKPRKEFDEISDLVAAYKFAMSHDLNETNLLAAHELLANNILIKGKRGKYRTDRMGVYDNNGLVYLAVEPEKVKAEAKLFFEDLKTLLAQKLDNYELFYHASFMHLKFAQIHPFWDGNGRASRLLEKWFLSEKLGEKAWKIESEQLYKTRISDYYKNINLGMDYYGLDYDRCIPFLKMLSDSLLQVNNEQA